MAALIAGLADRVQETTTTTGTGTVTLLGAVTDYLSFGTAFPSASTPVYYLIDDGAGNWEAGLGTYTLSGTTLSRTTVLSSSNGGAAVTFAAGTKKVSNVLPYKALVALLIGGQGEVTLTDAAAGTVAIDASLANSFYLLATGSSNTRKFGNPTNPTPGQTICCRYKLSSSGGNAITWDTKYKAATGISLIVASTPANVEDFWSAQYSAVDDTWFVTYNQGYS